MITKPETNLAFNTIIFSSTQKSSSQANSGNNFSSSFEKVSSGYPSLKRSCASEFSSHKGLCDCTRSCPPIQAIGYFYLKNAVVHWTYEGSHLNLHQLRERIPLVRRRTTVLRGKRA